MEKTVKPTLWDIILTITCIVYRDCLNLLVRQPLFVWFQLFYYNKGFLFYVVFIVISIAIRLVLSEMKDWEYI